MDAVDAFGAVGALPDLTTRTWRTPGAGKTSKPFKVRRAHADAIEVQTSRGGTVLLRSEAFDAAVKALGDLAEGQTAEQPGGADERWVRVSDEALLVVLSSENREHGVASYVLPLLEATGLIELDRGRPARARVRRV